MIRVIKLRINAVFLQNFGDLHSGIAERLRTQGDLQRLVSGHSIPVACKPLHQRFLLRQKSHQSSAKRRHAIVGRIQRLQNQIGGAAGAKQGHGRLCLLCQGRRRIVGNMQIRAAGNDRQRFMRRIAAKIRSQIYGMAGLRQEFQIRAVGVVHQQKYPCLMANLCNRLYVQHVSQIVRAGKIHRHRFFPAVLQRAFHLRRCNGTADIGVVILRVKPADINIQQCGGIDKGLVGVASG